MGPPLLGCMGNGYPCRSIRSQRGPLDTRLWANCILQVHNKPLKSRVLPDFN